MKLNKWPPYTGGIGAAAIFSMQASMPVSLAHTASRISCLFPSPSNHSAHPRLRLFTYTGLYRWAPIAGCSMRAGRPLSLRSQIL